MTFDYQGGMGLPRYALLLLPLAVSASLGVACVATEEESSEEQGDAVTGGEEKGGTPLVYLLSGTNARPSCVGTLLSERFAVTTRACAEAGRNLLVKRADEDKKSTVRVKQVHTPTGDADIALLELTDRLKGTTARISGLEVDDGYRIVGAAALATGRDDASVVRGEVQSQTTTQGLLFANEGQQICASDVGAGVFRKAPKKILFFKTGNWELSGLIVGHENGSVPSAAEVLDGGAPEAGASKDSPQQQPPQQQTATSPTQGSGCARGPWRVAPLALHAEFLKGLVPSAFPEPKPSGGSSGGFGGFPLPFPIPGLPGSGQGNGGQIRNCSLTAATLPTLRTGERTSTLQARASFANMPSGKALGQFGIAPRSSPASMVWSPATALDPTNGSSFESRFEGGVNAPSSEGDYVIGFRASADGGATWTQCDTDGSDNGFSDRNLVSVQVTRSAASNTDPAPFPNTSSSNDDDDDDMTDLPRTPEKAPAKKKASDGGCSTAPASRGTSGLPLVGLLLGLAAMVRRRR